MGFRCLMSISNAWFVVVFKCKSSEAKKTIVDFYRFIDNQNGVRSMHFLIRDRVEDMVVFSFRVMVEPKLKEKIKTKSASKLTTLLGADGFAIDPTANSDLRQYVAWSPAKRISDFGQTRFNLYVDLLKKMSDIAIDMIEKDYFGSTQRVEMAHAISWMLGCTEYGLLRTSGLEIGYYDRLEDKYSSYLRQNFQKENKTD